MSDHLWVIQQKQKKEKEWFPRWENFLTREEARENKRELEDRNHTSNFRIRKYVLVEEINT